MVVHHRALQALPTSLPYPLPVLIDVPPATLDAPAIDSLSYRQFLESLGVAVYTTDAEGRITFYNQAAARFWGREPELGELWCGSLRMYWPDGQPLPHDECPMAIALKEGRSVRGYEAIAERPDGTRVAFMPYPTVLEDADGTLIGAVNVIVDISDRWRAEDAAYAARAVKDEFLGLVSHELRTPVTTIFGNARLLHGRSNPGDLDAEMLEDIAADAERLLGIVENLLTLSRGDFAKIQGEPQILARVIDDVLTSFERRRTGRPIIRRLDARGLIVEADAEHIRLLVGNLLSNADKYSPPGEPIEVSLRRTDSQAEVTVLDRGIGIARDDLDELFTNFYRADEARKMSAGLGIGLSACKRVVELLGGRIWARPRDGGGAEFGFTLPLSDGAPEDAISFAG